MSGVGLAIPPDIPLHRAETQGGLLVPADTKKRLPTFRTYEKVVGSVACTVQEWMINKCLSNNCSVACTMQVWKRNKCLSSMCSRSQTRHGNTEEPMQSLCVSHTDRRKPKEPQRTSRRDEYSASTRLPSRACFHFPCPSSFQYLCFSSVPVSSPVCSSLKSTQADIGRISWHARSSVLITRYRTLHRT